MLRLPPDPTHGPPGKPLAYLLKVTRAPSRFWVGRPRPCGHTATQHVERMVLSTRELAPVGVRAHVPDRHRQTHSGHPRPALDPASGWNRAKLPQRTLETPTKRPHTQQVRCSLLGWAPRAPPRTAPRKKDQKPPGSQGSLVWYRRHRFSPWHPWPPTTIRCRPRTCDYPHPTVVTTTLVTQWPGLSARPLRSTPHTGPNPQRRNTTLGGGLGHSCRQIWQGVGKGAATPPPPPPKKRGIPSPSQNILMCLARASGMPPRQSKEVWKAFNSLHVPFTDKDIIRRALWPSCRPQKGYITGPNVACVLCVWCGVVGSPRHVLAHCRCTPFVTDTVNKAFVTIKDGSGVGLARTPDSLIPLSSY